MGYGTVVLLEASNNEYELDKDEFTERLDQITDVEFLRKYRDDMLYIYGDGC